MRADPRGGHGLGLLQVAQRVQRGRHERGAVDLQRDLEAVLGVGVRVGGQAGQGVDAAAGQDGAHLGRVGEIAAPIRGGVAVPERHHRRVGQQQRHFRRLAVVVVAVANVDVLRAQRLARQDARAALRLDAQALERGIDRVAALLPIRAHLERGEARVVLRRPFEAVGRELVRRGQRGQLDRARLAQPGRIAQHGRHVLHRRVFHLQCAQQRLQAFARAVVQRRQHLRQRRRLAQRQPHGQAFGQARAGRHRLVDHALQHGRGPGLGQLVERGAGLVAFDEFGQQLDHARIMQALRERREQVAAVARIGAAHGVGEQAERPAVVHAQLQQQPRLLVAGPDRHVLEIAAHGLGRGRGVAQPQVALGAIVVHAGLDPVLTMRAQHGAQQAIERRRAGLRLEQGDDGVVLGVVARRDRQAQDGDHAVHDAVQALRLRLHAAREIERHFHHERQAVQRDAHARGPAQREAAKVLGALVALHLGVEALRADLQPEVGVALLEAGRLQHLLAFRGAPELPRAPHHGGELGEALLAIAMRIVDEDDGLRRQRRAVGERGHVDAAHDGDRGAQLVGPLEAASGPFDGARGLAGRCRCARRGEWRRRGCRGGWRRRRGRGLRDGCRRGLGRRCRGRRGRERGARRDAHLRVAAVRLFLDQLVVVLARRLGARVRLGLRLAVGADAAEAHRHVGAVQRHFPELARGALDHLESSHHALPAPCVV